MTFITKQATLLLKILTKIVSSVLNLYTMLSIEQLKKLFPDWEQGLYESVLENEELKEANDGEILLKKGNR